MRTITTAGATVKPSKSTEYIARLREFEKEIVRCQNALHLLSIESEPAQLSEEVIFAAGLMLYELRVMVETAMKD